MYNWYCRLVLRIHTDWTCNIKQVVRIQIHVEFTEKEVPSCGSEVYNFIYNKHDYYEVFGIFIQCYRDTIMRLLREEDPEGCEQRRRRRLKRRVYRDKVSLFWSLISCSCELFVNITQGPNYLWHVDGYDKLTPYGLTIHSCIDG